MELSLQPGRYVAAVSGGVDSVVLLHLLLKHPDIQITVAHYDHGIRADAQEDRLLVQRLTRKYGVPFVYDNGRLGSDVSEATARRARYDFLHKVRSASGAQAIITAHHQDDLLETAIMNLLRGTNRRGLSSLKSSDVIKRPLLNVPKKELLGYAEREELSWREDSTNADERYLRNYLRKNIMPRFANENRERLLQILERAAELNQSIEEQSINYLHMQPAVGILDRYSFIMLSHVEAREIMAEWLLRNTGVELSKKLLERLVQAAKTGKSGTEADIDKQHILKIGRTQLALNVRER
jgi:tRNA(Ile)-lysidine synthetase-like protein